MRKGIVGLIAWSGMILFAAQGYAQTVGSGEEKKLGTDNIDEQCVINCLQGDKESSSECTRADVIACRSVCNLPPPVILSIGGFVVNPDIDDPGKIQGAFLSAARSIGVDEQNVQTVITYSKNRLAEFGINQNIAGILTYLPLDAILPDLPDLGNTVATSGEIPCMASKTYTYSSGTKGLGCREIPKFGTAGWAALGCGAQSSSTGTNWYGDWSSFCCNALGRPCPTCVAAAGYGVCTVNSTTPGDGVY